MDTDTILRIKPALTQYCHGFDGFMGRVTNRRHLQTCVAGQLGDLQRKSLGAYGGRRGSVATDLAGVSESAALGRRDMLQRRANDLKNASGDRKNPWGCSTSAGRS